MKKILAVLVLLCLIPLAIADNATNSTNSTTTTVSTTSSTTTTLEDASTGSEDNVTVDEVAVMNSPLGAEIRLLQLERALMHQILLGQDLIDAVQENFGYNTSSLEDALLNLEGTLEQVQELSPENTSGSAASFVALKHGARDTSKVFKDKLHEMLSKDELQELRNLVSGDYHEKLSSIDEAIKAKIREHNAQIMQKKLQRWGVEDPELVDKITQGSLTLGQVRSQMVKKYKELAPKDRKQVAMKIKEAKAQREVFKEKTKERFEDKMTQVRMNVAEKVGQLKDRFTEKPKIAERLANLQERIMQLPKRLNPDDKNRSSIGNEQRGKRRRPLNQPLRDGGLRR